MYNMQWIIAFLCITYIKGSMIIVPETKSPYDILWHDFSSPSPYNDNIENISETTAVNEPFFDETSSQVNVSAQLGNDAILHCRVNDLREKTVSWLKRKGEQLHLITIGASTYSGDSRYSIEFKPPNDWQLQIKYVNERDEGQFECQVNTQPSLALVVSLEVIVPRVEIIDERGLRTPDKFYKSGSTIELKCVISKMPQPTNYVTWKHGLRMLNYDTSRGGISVKTNLNSMGAVSRLYIANANKYDNGNYTCSLGESVQTTVTVHILNGENPAAAQHSETDSANFLIPLNHMLIYTLLLISLINYR
ncbi:zwei Ig domain protein zig-8-like isoform X1 [Chironomus tepperi]|uniref:zwei Ig domain protein zig-8-like isoform X1 n=1 Tax=Chironomus tepperi TaxID=113505 RepID=UPI00391F9A3C